MNRRDLIAVAAGASLPALAAAKAPKSPQGLRIFNARDFGAAGTGKKLDTAAINSALDTCNAAGGGVVYLPPGTYLSGTVVLKSNVTLYLEAGATLLGSKNLADYSPQPGPPEKGDANQKHLVFARDAENVGIAGHGRIDGQGESFWIHKPRSISPDDLWRDVATYDWKPGDRPSPMLEFVGCRHLRLEDMRIENASGWTVRPINCDDVVIRGITIKNPVYGPNTDGLDITGCQNVFIADCHIDTGDDAICLKSENPYGGEPRVGRNITITNCVLTCCCNGLKFGTATRGGFENVTFSNSVICNEDVPLNARVISGIALEMVDGGWLEGVTISNIRMQRVRTPIFIRRGIRRARPDGTPGVLRGVMIDNIHATGSILTSSVTGLPGFPVEDVTLSNIRIETEEAGKEEWVSRDIPEMPKAYPEARMFGRLPSYGLYCRHVNGLSLRNWNITALRGDARPALLCDDVTDLRMEDLEGNAVSKTQAAIKLIDTRSAWLLNCAAPQGTRTFLQVEGEKTERIAVSGCKLAGIEHPVQLGKGVSQEHVTLFGNSEKS